MKTSMFNVRHRGRVGPGGWRCTCCGPAPAHRKEFARRHKKFVYRLLNQLEKEDSK